MKYFDAHTHLNLEKDSEIVNAIATKMLEMGVWGNNVGIDLESSQRAVELAGKHEHLFATIGYHPTDVVGIEVPINELEQLIENPKVIAVGEIGFDFFRTPKGEVIQSQESAFRAQIDLALRYDKPVILHMRPTRGTMDAYVEGLRVLREYKDIYGDKLRGDAHFFAGSPEIAQQFFDIGFYISFTGVITFTDDYNEVLKMAPVDRIMAETDAPYIAPVPYRGKPGEAWQVIEVYKKIAQVRGIDFNNLQSIINYNSEKLFKL